MRTAGGGSSAVRFRFPNEMFSELISTPATGSILSAESAAPVSSLAICQCGNPLFPENLGCVACGAAVGFIPSLQLLCSFSIDASQGGWQPTGAWAGPRRSFKPCDNRDHGCGCNWMIPVENSNSLCLSCSLTRTIPDLSLPGSLELWGRAEQAKRLVLAQLLRLSLPVARRDEQGIGLTFDLLRPRPDENILTGHADGVITLNLNEAVDANREAMREQMGEKYRTLAGHMRHELAHYYWAVLSGDPSWLGSVRVCFGDDRQDYSSALQRHHQYGAPPDWNHNYISAYASSHPWEDWAETFAHYLHIEEGLHIAATMGLEINSLRLRTQSFGFEPLRGLAERPVGAVFVRDINRWIRLSVVLNEFATGLGHAHVSPFVLNSVIVQKLWHVHESIQLLKQNGQGQSRVD